MPSPDPIVPPGSGHPFVRAVRAQWRALTGGSDVRDPERRTLVACSGGADSAALVLALADRPIEIAHVVHDLRPEPEALADRDAVADLARSLNRPFLEASVRVAEMPGNLEANARNARYDALARLAAERSIAFVATAHHADDQLETLLLRLARGAGVHGLRGIAPIRSLGRIRVIRPMLNVTHDDAKAFCRSAGFTWRDDVTNEDISRSRAALRKRVVPLLLEIEPRARAAAGRAAHQMRLAAAVLDRERQRLLAEARTSDAAIAWERSLLAAEPPGLIAAAIRAAADRMCSDERKDRRSSTPIMKVVRAVRDESPHQRRFDWWGVAITVTQRFVVIERNQHA